MTYLIFRNGCAHLLIGSKHAPAGQSLHRAHIRQPLTGPLRSRPIHLHHLARHLLLTRRHLVIPHVQLAVPFLLRSRLS
jgi:hypothetical protein